jgi:exosome complex RNA-binding protein Rrp42 (RNase PH superfamily)
MFIERQNKLILLRNPISITCGVFDDIFIVDPDEQEQLIMRGTVTCVIDENNNICTLSQRVSDKGLSFQQLQEVALLSIKKSIEIRKKISW